MIPSAWKNVWICSTENGHLQATGMDALGRKQYRYHPRWTAMRKMNGFFGLYEFGKALPHIREHLKKDISLANLPPEKVKAALVSLMEGTQIRIGNKVYEKEYGSVGLSTMKEKNVKIEKGEKLIRFPVQRQKRSVP